MAKNLSQILQRADDDLLPVTRGLGAMAKTAAAPVSVDELEREIGAIVRENRPPRKEAFVPLGPLSEEAKNLKSASVISGAEVMMKGAKAAVAAYRADSEALQKAVDEWCNILEQQAQEMAETIARHHDSLIQAQKLFHQAMKEHRPIPVIDLPNPLPDGSGGDTSRPDDKNEVGEPTVRHYNSAAGD